ncbi:hypothetical protein JKP88DRAFT_159079 [Tribonema minus]|uniref:Uncharacterized protein n=1 Tax=Tribonema minus TaxID=303371 RepID=A0A836C9P5_9STRA|nr:hypothetical protein JKP88DRAFT_159079 [Tribonema minus]
MAVHTEASRSNGSDASGKLFIFGVGYTGLAIAVSAMNRGYTVSGTCTSDSKLQALQNGYGISTFLFDGTEPLSIEGVAAITSCTHVLSTIPPGADGTEPVLLHHARHLQRSTRLQWLGYLSSTGVYGDAGGDWVTEHTPPSPTTLKARARLTAERAWQDSDSRVPARVFRLAGIYGPGRSALDTLVAKDGDMAACAGARDAVTPVSRIHVADIAQARCRGAPAAAPPLLVNLADARPASRHEVFAHAARLLGCAAVPAAADAAYVSARGGGSKRVDGTLLRRMLQARGLQLVYPDYESGLAAVAEERAFRISNLQS